MSPENMSVSRVLSYTHAMAPATLSAAMAPARLSENVNFYYSLIDPERGDTEDNRRYHNQIENVEYQGGFEERVGALLICGSNSLIQTITFVGGSCNKFIATSHAFYGDYENEDPGWQCEAGDYGTVHKIARKDYPNLDPAARAVHPWHGGLDPADMDNYDWITEDEPLAVNERGRVDNTRFGLGGGDRFFGFSDRHNDIQMLRLQVPTPSSDGVGNACSGTSNLEFVNISKMTDYLPLRQCFIHARMQKEEDTGVYQGERTAQLSIYRNTEPCHVIGPNEGNTTGLVFNHNCPSHNASSGAPIMCEIDGQYKVVGIHVGSRLSYNKIQDPRLSTVRDFNIGVGFNDRFLEEIRD